MREEMHPTTEASNESTARHLVLVHRYFWPDTPTYANILKEIAGRLVEEGHRVTVLTCQPSYNRAVVGRAASRERLSSGVDVRRWPVLDDRRSNARKMVNLVAFCVRLLFARRQVGDVDVVMAASTPPIAVAKVASWLAARCGASFVYHKQDIYPEVVTAPGILRRPRLARFLRWLDSRTERRAARTVVLSRDMAETVRLRGSDDARIQIINNFDPWTLQESAASATSSDASDRRTLDVVFAGNLGRFQNLETVMAAAFDLRSDEAIRFHLFGDGALRGWIEDELRSNQVGNMQLYGYRPPDEIADFLRTQADVGLVSLVPGVVYAAYPSKTMSYLRQGCPIVALVEQDTELAESLRVSGAGIQVDPTDSVDLVKALRGLKDDIEFRSQARKSATALYREQFDRNRQLDAWARTFAQVVEEPR